MKGMVIYIEMEGYLRQWLKHSLGDPVKFPNKSFENGQPLFFLTLSILISFYFADDINFNIFATIKFCDNEIQRVDTNFKEGRMLRYRKTAIRPSPLVLTHNKQILQGEQPRKRRGRHRHHESHQESSGNLKTACFPWQTTMTLN